MANVSIDQPVGIRNGVTVLPNRQSDLDKVTGLFDGIAVSNGGTREDSGAWMTQRDALIAQVAAQIVTFQTTNALSVIDGAIDPRGGTLKLMNKLAGQMPGPGITARVAPTPTGFADQDDSAVFQAVEITSMPGTGPMRPMDAAVSYVRRLVRVEGSSINWFGVLFPKGDSGVSFGKVPHIFFTPGPWQGGYSDGSYDSFGGSPPWGRLWHDYTWGMGRQVVTAGTDQFLVIPFYRNSQHSNLGDFLTNWKDAISAAVTAAIDSLDPTYLRDSFTFDKMYSSSFSNGWIPHKQFNTKGVGAGDITELIFDLDGQAASPPSHWRPLNGIIYLNRPAPPAGNPFGNEWYVGGRWRQFEKYWPGGIKTHNACASYLLYHGVWQFTP